MYGLYGALLAKGQEVHLNVRYNPGVPCVAIYPEIAHGNPLEGQTVVRYILNKPGIMTSSGVPGPGYFAPTDKKYYFSRLFGGTEKDKYLFLPILDLHLWKDQGKKRTKTVYFVGKGVNHNIHPLNSVLIDRKLAQDQQALADLLNECTVLHSYDPVSAMTEIARLCGVKVVMHDYTYNRDEYDLKYEPGINGMGWSKETDLDVSAFRERYTALQAQFDTDLDKFIEEMNNE